MGRSWPWKIEPSQDRTIHRRRRQIVIVVDRPRILVTTLLLVHRTNNTVLTAKPDNCPKLAPSSSLLHRQHAQHGGDGEASDCRPAGRQLRGAVQGLEPGVESLTGLNCQPGVVSIFCCIGGPPQRKLPNRR